MTGSRPLKHFTAGAIVVTAELPHKVLLVHHRKLDAWMQPGGHVESYENPRDAAIREVREETGLDISAVLAPTRSIDAVASYLPLPTYLLEENIPAHGDEPEHYHIDMIYTVQLPHQAASHDASESRAVGWFTREELANIPMLENVRELAIEELQK